ncbi:hypothetical protein ACCO45_005330 [Purpureocillium lilacinum]|uniref:Uncharacterized protein n=1 Tax=Purpureocillium lilacinum TaxID=33203 RepID=A0ACC4DVZ9_PURLI
MTCAWPISTTTGQSRISFSWPVAVAGSVIVGTKGPAPPRLSLGYIVAREIGAAAVRRPPAHTHTHLDWPPSAPRNHWTSASSVNERIVATAEIGNGKPTGQSVASKALVLPVSLEVCFPHGRPPLEPSTFAPNPLFSNPSYGIQSSPPWAQRLIESLVCGGAQGTRRTAPPRNNGACQLAGTLVRVGGAAPAFDFGAGRDKFDKSWRVSTRPAALGLAGLQ